MRNLNCASEVVIFGPCLDSFASLAKVHLGLPWLIVDGGINPLISGKYRPLLLSKIEKKEVQWIGDGDSKISLPKKMPGLLFPSHKDESDLELALELIPRAKKIILYGMWGGRFDHHLANFGVLSHFCKSAGKMAVFTEGAVILGPGKWALSYSKNFSLILFQRGEIKLRGACRFKLAKSTSFPPLSPWGISNLWIPSKKNKKVLLTTKRPTLYLPNSLKIVPHFLGKI